MKKFLFVIALSSFLFGGLQQHQQPKHDAKWDYKKHGPEHWGDFSEVCKKGKNQSPINIIPAKTVALNSTYEIKFNEDKMTKSKVFDNGHSIKVVVEDGGEIVLKGKKYKLIQFHFHGKSEHLIDGRRYDMVAHMVHQAKDGSLAVIAIMFEVGEKNRFIQKIIDNIGKILYIDPQELLPKDVNHYYHYIGSLTTPPCSEGVNWYILKDTDSISKEQLERFRKYYIDNERPIQPINTRVVESK